jgi:hypothetical protein
MTRKRWVKLFALVAAILVWAGSTPSGFGFLLPPREGPVGEKHRPIVEAIAAQNDIREGSLWKIYLRASDPDGDLDKIFVSFSQLGADFTPDLLPQKTKVQVMNGYILVWAKLEGGAATSDIYGQVDIRVEDRAGNYSEPKIMSFTLGQYGQADRFVPPAEFNSTNSLGQAEFPLLADDLLVGDDGRD